MNLLLDRVASPIGTILLVSDDDTFLRALDFEEFEPRLHRLLRRHYGSYHLTPAAAAEAVRRAIAAYFDGDLAALDAIPVRTGGSEFQRRVWAELRRIPPGRPISYGRLATAIGAPKASRAVGMANGANPVALVVPCHRVIGADATLTGYGGGLHRKAWLLEHEARASPGPGGPLQ
jgi:methylated-DNA-[protein]-cysteine S-methyltransferase